MREEGFEVCHRQRFAEQVALVQVATGLAQRNALLFGFNPFGNHVQPQAAREPDDGVHDGGVVGVGEHVAHKALVDLELIERHALEVAQ